MDGRILERMAGNSEEAGRKNLHPGGSEDYQPPELMSRELAKFAKTAPSVAVLQGSGPDFL
ncbi:MAG: hypothetical protein R3C49_09000 [Planctomycetaceae bacterium]